MHSPVYLAICAAAVVGMLFIGTPRLSSMVLASAFAIAVLGVPHGGLDHWTGRRLLQRRFANAWWAVFFPAYLLIGLLFAFGWFVAPTFTVIAFFIVSAWHFGREDQCAHDGNDADSLTNGWGMHLSALSLGGLVIWIPSLLRPMEMQTLLSLITFSGINETASQIVDLTQFIAVGLTPFAILLIAARVFAAPRSWLAWAPVGTLAVAACTPILISFSIYFCVWHSWQGLQRLRAQERLSPAQFARYVAPLSSAAIVGAVLVATAGWLIQGSSTELIIANANSATLRTTFIGLSAIAVPHLFLHEFDGLMARSHSQSRVTA